ncbi:hypothetical protein D3C80_2178120 [compost metagenome]
MVQACQSQYPQELFGRGFRFADHDVFPQRAVEQARFLTDVTNRFTPVRRVDLVDVQAIGEHLSVHRQVQTRHHP